MTRRLAALLLLWLRTLPQAFRLCASLLGAVTTSGARLGTMLMLARLRDGRFRPDARLLVATWRELASSAVRECAGIIASRVSIGLAIAVWAVYACAGWCLCKLLPDVGDATGHGLAPAPHVFQSIEGMLDASPQTGRGRGLVFH